ncbi:MAG: hypothetical protein GY941_12140 [Planctomycetes bacterium]|nr:hypothetical protein [Planctomycetota bacterium]
MGKVRATKGQLSEDEISGDFFNLLVWVADASRERIMNEVREYIENKYHEDEAFMITDEMMQELMDSGKVGVSTFSVTDEYSKSGLN